MRYFWIIVVLMAAWQAVSSLIERATKKQQEQRLRELAAQRQRQMAGRGGEQRAGTRAAPAAGPGPGPGRIATPPTAGRARSVVDRAEALAERRRAQLEELRRRRATRQGPAQLRPTATPAPASPGLPAPVQVTRPVRRPPATPPARPGRPQPAPASRPRPRPQILAEPHETEARQSPAEQPRGRAAPPPQRPAARRIGLAEGGERTGRHLLRKMVLYKEILDPPVSLRDRAVWERL